MKAELTKRIVPEIAKVAIVNGCISSQVSHDYVTQHSFV